MKISRHFHHRAFIPSTFFLFGVRKAILKTGVSYIRHTEFPNRRLPILLKKGPKNLIPPFFFSFPDMFPNFSIPDFYFPLFSSLFPWTRVLESLRVIGTTASIKGRSLRIIQIGLLRYSALGLTAVARQMNAPGATDTGTQGHTPRSTKEHQGAPMTNKVAILLVSICASFRRIVWRGDGQSKRVGRRQTRV